MGWTVEGSCKQCGRCCKIEMRTGFMLKIPNSSTNPDVWCAYLFEEDGKWWCEIRQAYEEGDTEFIEMLSDRVREYYLRECEPYPDPSRRAHVPPRHTLLDGCGYEVLEVV
jgi:hypothetical protein